MQPIAHIRMTRTLLGVLLLLVVSVATWADYITAGSMDAWQSSSDRYGAYLPLLLALTPLLFLAMAGFALNLWLHGGATLLVDSQHLKINTGSFGKIALADIRTGYVAPAGTSKATPSHIVLALNDGTIKTITLAGVIEDPDAVLAAILSAAGRKAPAKFEE